MKSSGVQRKQPEGARPDIQADPDDPIRSQLLLPVGTEGACNIVSLLVVGTVALDSVKPSERWKRLGGTASYFSLRGRHYTDVKIVAVERISSSIGPIQVANRRKLTQSLPGKTSDGRDTTIST